MRMNGAIAPFKILNNDYGNVNSISTTTTPTILAPLKSSNVFDMKELVSSTSSAVSGLVGGK